MVDVEDHNASFSIFHHKTRLGSSRPHALWAVFHRLFGGRRLQVTAGLWNKRTVRCYATVGGKGGGQHQLNVSSATVNAHKNTLLEMCSKYCSGEKFFFFFQCTCRTSASQSMEAFQTFRVKLLQRETASSQCCICINECHSLLLVRMC